MGGTSCTWKPKGVWRVCLHLSLVREHVASQRFPRLRFQGPEASWGPAADCPSWRRPAPRLCPPLRPPSLLPCTLLSIPAAASLPGPGRHCPSPGTQHPPPGPLSTLPTSPFAHNTQGHLRSKADPVTSSGLAKPTRTGACRTHPAQCPARSAQCALAQRGSALPSHSVPRGPRLGRGLGAPHQLRTEE